MDIQIRLNKSENKYFYPCFKYESTICKSTQNIFFNMGFWGSLWSGIKKVAGAVYNNVIAPVARTVVKIVAPIVTPIVNVVKKTFNVVSNIVSKGISYIEKGVSYVTDLYERGKNWFLEETYIGKKLKQGYDYVMNETFIGKGIKKVAGFIQNVSDKFYNDTWIGRMLSAAKQWFDNTAVGKFVNKIAPIVNLAGTLLGGVGGLVGSIASGASKVVSFIRNPSSLLNVPYIRDSQLFQRASNLYQKGKDMVDKIRNNAINPTFNFISDKYTQTLNKVKETKAFETLRNVYDKGKDAYKNVQQKVITPTSTYLKEKVPTLINGLKEKAPSIVYHTANTLASTYRNVKAASSFLMDKVKDTSLYQKAVTRPYEKLVDLYQKGRIEATKKYQLINIQNDEEPLVQKVISIAEIVKDQVKSNGVDSSSMISSYAKKYGEISQENGLKIMEERFQTLDCDKPRQIPLLNKVLKDSSKIEFKRVTFSAGQTRQSKDYTIQGKMKLLNKSSQKIVFEIDSGQVFGCSVQNTSQHVVVRKLRGELEPQEEKQFILQGFCGDLSLKWPYDDNNYTLSSLKLKEFKEDMDQDQVWQKTS